VIVGYGGTLSIPTGMMVGEEKGAFASLVGTWPDLYEIVQLHATGRLTLRSQTHPLDAINDVLDALREGEITGRAVLVP
jgi:NAD+-dependent secondary alcohol dehydrogenase Adh1